MEHDTEDSRSLVKYDDEAFEVRLRQDAVYSQSRVVQAEFLDLVVRLLAAALIFYFVFLDNGFVVRLVGVVFFTMVALKIAVVARELSIYQHLRNRW